MVHPRTKSHQYPSAYNLNLFVQARNGLQRSRQVMLSPSRSRYIKRVELLRALTSLLKYVQENLLCGARDSLL